MKLVRFIAVSGCLLGLMGCVTAKPVEVVEYYQTAYRQYPPDRVYSRATWSHVPHAIAPKTQEPGPLMQPALAVDLPESTLEEAVEALAQMIGYDWHYPENIASRPVSIRMEGTAEEVLDEINKQADVFASFDHNTRTLRVRAMNTMPALPTREGAGLSQIGEFGTVRQDRDSIAQ